MKKKYSKKLIWDYITGEEIANVEKLEEDSDFMIDVITITQDKKLYSLCSDTIKRNYEFVKFMVEQFKNDKEFIVKVADFYLATVDKQDVTYYELVIIMKKILKYENLGESKDLDEAIYRYNIVASTLLATEKLAIVAEIQKEKDQFWKKELGLGFLLIKTGIGYQSEVICEYFATEYLIDILKEDGDMNLEDFLHKHFTSFEIIKQQGLHNFLITYISLYDSNLAEYVSNHLYLLKDALWIMKRIETNWKNYEKMTLEDKEDLFEKLANEKIEKYHSFYSYGEYCMHLDQMNLNLPLQLGFYKEEDYQDNLNCSKLRLSDAKCLKEIIELAKKIFLDKELDNSFFTDDLETQVNYKKAKILSFESQKKIKEKS